MYEKAKVKIREIADSDVDQVFSLHDMAHQESRSSKDWLWEYRGSYPKSSVFVIAQDSDRIIGTQGMIPIYLNVRGKRCLTGKSENSLIDKRYRGGTLFQEMYNAAMTKCHERGMCCVWGFTTASKVWRNKLHFSVYENVVQTYALTLRPGALPERVKSRVRFAIPVLVWLSYLYSLLCRYAFISFNVRGKKDVVIENRTRTENDLNGLYGRLTLKYSRLIYIEQDSKYLTWRIINNPTIRYTTYFLYEGELLRAYCYLNIHDKTAHITDFTCEDRTNGAFLLQHVIHDLSKQQTRFVLFLGNVTNHLTAAILGLFKRLGFLRLGMLQTNFVLQNISCDENLSDAKDWYINGLWTEGYEW